jgi:eukaryotic-like serine/threonine-protein kinase
MGKGPRAASRAVGDVSSSQETPRAPPMSTERWIVLGPLLDTALDLSAEERVAFFERIRQEDGLLADEAERLLIECERPDPFFGVAAAERFGSLLDEEPPRLLGDRFLLSREIGRGGMATVHLAHDRKHDRSVAVKVLGPAASAEIGVDRFLREIRVAARLQHAHIVPLYDSGDESGWLFYVMPLMNGESLRDRLSREGRLPLDVALRITGEIGDALEYAHKHGVVHRDVKPENVLFDEGRALLADFGISRLAERTSQASDRITGAGMLVGTPGYMSPEQRDGRAVDVRSDVYSLACVLHEMLVGALPAIDGSTTNLALPPSLEGTLRKALAVAPEQRFSSVGEFVRSLGVVEPPPTSIQRTTSVAAMWRRHRRAVVGGALTALAVALFALRTRSSRNSSSDVTPGRLALSIAVQPFDILSSQPDDDYLADGLVDDLTASLARLRGVSVVPRSSSIKYRKIDSRVMGESLHVSWVLEGTLSHVGSRLHVRPTLVSVDRGHVAWSAAYDRELRDVADVRRDIVRAIADTLGVTFLASSVPRARAPANIDAYTNYLKGRSFLNQRMPAALDTAVTYFHIALKYDSSYAPAYAGLADAYSLRGVAGVAPHETFRLARAAAQHAVVLDSTLAAAHASLGFIEIWYDWDWTAGKREIDRAVALDSTYAPAALFRAWYLIPHRSLSEAVKTAMVAQRLEPLSPAISVAVGSILAYSHRLPDAEASLRKTLETNPGSPIAAAQLARVLAVIGRAPEALSVLPASTETLGGYEAGIRGFVLARAGNRRAAIEEIQKLRKRADENPDAIAAVYAGLRDHDEAIAWLERAYAARSATCVVLALEPMFDWLHGDPRFKRLVDRINPPTIDW